MKKRTTLLLVIILSIELISFCWKYVLGPLGITLYARVKADNEQLELAVNKVREEIRILEEDIAELKEYPWYKEKIARQELQMGFQGEEVFLIS